MKLINDRHTEFLFMVGFTLMALVEAFVFHSVFFATAWALMALIHLLVFEWKTNPERYDWFGQNPDFSGAIMMFGMLIYWVVAGAIFLF